MGLPQFIWGKDLFWNIIKGRVQFAKRLKGGRDLKQIGERGGFWANVPFSSSSDRETEERGRLAGGGPGRRLGARGRPWSGGKETGKGEGPIPYRGLGGGGPWGLGHGGGRRRPLWCHCGARWWLGAGGKARGSPGD